MTQNQTELPLIVKSNGNRFISVFSENIIKFYVYLVTCLYGIASVVFLITDFNSIKNCNDSHIIEYNCTYCFLFIITNIYFDLAFEYKKNLITFNISLVIFHLILIVCGIYELFIFNYSDNPNDNCSKLIICNYWILTHISFYISIISFPFYIISIIKLVKLIR